MPSISANYIERGGKHVIVLKATGQKTKEFEFVTPHAARKAMKRAHTTGVQMLREGTVDSVTTKIERAK